MKKEVIETLNRTINTNTNSWKILVPYLYLKLHPRFDFLRSDPRFQKILTQRKEQYEENLAKYGDIDI